MSLFFIKNILGFTAVILALYLSKYFKIKELQISSSIRTGLQYFVFFLILIINTIVTFSYVNALFSYALLVSFDLLDKLALILAIVIGVLTMALLEALEIDNIFKNTVSEKSFATYSSMLFQVRSTLAIITLVFAFLLAIIVFSFA